MLYDVLKTSDF